LRDLAKLCFSIDYDEIELKGVLNPNFQPFNFELRKIRFF